MSSDQTEHVTDSAEKLLTRLRNSSLPSRREFLRRSAAVGGGALALSVAGSNAALAHDAESDDVSDVDVLNYALTLEHLEYAFYRDGLKKFDEEALTGSETLGAFGDAITQDVHTNFADIRDHEKAHVDTLTKVITDLGGEPVEEDNYDFGVSNADEFIAVAAVLENTGVSAYDGAIHLIGNADLLTAGATIATVEARHASYLNVLNGEDPFPAAFDETKTMEEVIDAASQFIVEC